MAARRSREEIIKALEARIQKLKEPPKAAKTLKLIKSSAGMADAIAAIENAATQNGASVAEVIKAISRIKRTGLQIAESTRKARE